MKGIVLLQLFILIGEATDRSKFFEDVPILFDFEFVQVGGKISKESADGKIKDVQLEGEWWQYELFDAMK